MTITGTLEGETDSIMNETNESILNGSTHEAWTNMHGIKIKQFNSADLSAFKKPFDQGWKREIVLRGNSTSAPKKLGDVYYFSPDKTKLRSCVELGLFCK